MTDVSTSPAPARRDRDEQFVRRMLLLRRDNPGARSALRRGDTAALADRALPYLEAWRFKAYEIDAALLFAAAISRYSGIANVPTTPLGRAAFRTLSAADRHDPASTSVGRRVVAAQRQRLPLAHRTFTGLLTSIDAQLSIGLDWTGLWRLYRGWDQPDLEYQRISRRRLLLDFYGTSPSSDDQTIAT